jgi:diaminohydroxyphosphoribosylaminopyrimidine deaminase/5-amino-6-(5-phosphoribosylamino)uracil reductase
VLEDDPRLDVRAVPTVLQPLRVVVDSRLQTPPSARLLAPPGRGVIIFGAADDAPRRVALQAAGAEVLLQAPTAGVTGNASAADAKVDLNAMLATLAERGVNELHVEAGHKLNASLLRAGLVDELLVYLAPKMMGIGREMAAFGPLESLADALSFEFVETSRVGDDLRLRLRPPGRDRF